MTNIYQGSSGINAKEYNLLINITNTALNMLDYSEAAQPGKVDFNKKKAKSQTKLHQQIFLIKLINPANCG